MAHKRNTFNLDDFELSPSARKKIRAELARAKRGSGKISSSKEKKIIEDATRAARKDFILKRKKAKIRLQDNRFKKFLKKALFPEKKNFLSGLGSLFRNRRFRNSVGSSAQEAGESFIGKSNFKKFEKIRKTLALNRKLRVRQFGAVLGVAALGLAIASNKSGVRQRKRSVGRPRFKSRSVGRPKSKRRVGRPSFKSKR